MASDVRSLGSSSTSQRVGERQPLLPAALANRAVDGSVQRVAQTTFNKNTGFFGWLRSLWKGDPRPLHTGSLEGTIMPITVVGAASGVRDLIVQETGEPVSNVDAPFLATGALTVAVGGLMLQRGVYGIKAASQKEDDIGIGVSFTRFTRGPADIIRGSTKVTTGAIAAAGKASALAGVMNALGIVTTAGSAVTALSLGTLCALYLGQTVQIRGEFKKKLQEGNEAAFTYLRELHSLTEEDKKRVLDKLFKPKEVSHFEKGYKKLAHYISEKFWGKQESKEDKELKKALKATNRHGDVLGDNTQLITIARGYPRMSMSIEVLSERGLEIENRLKAVLGSETGLSEAQIRQLTLNIEGLYGRALENEKARKETVFARTVGSKAQEMIEPLMNKSIAAISAAEIKEVVETARVGLRNNTIMLALGVFASTIWLGAIITGQVLTSGGLEAAKVAVTLALLIVSIVIMGIYLIVDGYFLYQEYKNTGSLKKDKVFMALAGMVSGAAMGFAAASAESALNIGLTAGAAGVWLAVLGYTLYNWKEKSQEAAQPPAPLDEGYQGSGAAGSIQ